MPFSLQSKADLYGNLRSLIVDGGIELLDHAESIREIRGLELEALPGGQSRIGHGRRAGSRDDFADAIAIASMDAVRHRGGAFDPENFVICGPPSMWTQDILGGSSDDDYGLRPGEQIVGQMNDRGRWEKLGGW